MSNICDYMQWRGDLSFELDPFNEVDNIILCQISYVNVDGLAPGIGDDYLSLYELSEQFFALHSQEELEKDKTFTRMAPFVLKEAAKTKRFRDIKIGNYVNYLDRDTSLQMSAMELCLSDHSSFIAFRGTDDRIASWKEDFLLAGSEVSSQKEAVAYLNNIGTAAPHKKLILGGHSKGGHMAVYAAAYCETEIKDRIAMIYNNDGPGFRKKILESENIRSIQDRIRRLIPEESIVGLLLEHKSVPTIIASSGKGIMQHDAMTWQVIGNHFVLKNSLSTSSMLIDTTMSNWMENFTDAKRVDFVNKIFSILEEPGVETLTELQNGGIANLILMRKKLDELDPETKSMVDMLLRGLLNNWSEHISEVWQKRWESFPKLDKHSV